MPSKIKKFMILLLPFILAFSLGASVLADDDDHERGEHQKTEYYEKSDDEGYENEGNENNNYEQGSTANNVMKDDYWNIWLRQPLNNADKPLPITSPSEISINVNGKMTKIYFIPQDGQLLVSGAAIANALGAKAEYYPQSKIMVMTNDNYELIVRVGSNAVYENRIKNPMPVKAAAYEKTVYLPVSVAANALGYRITWNAQNNTMMLESI